MSKRIRTRIPKTETITARKSKTQRDYPALRFMRFGLWDGSELKKENETKKYSGANDFPEGFKNIFKLKRFAMSKIKR